MTPAVSIIIPTFRRPQRAVDAARSALAQTAPDFEIVLVDNDPEGSALGVLRAFDDPRITVIHEPRAGVANARNAGLRVAKGELIAFLDDDELAPATWLAELLRVQARTARRDDDIARLVAEADARMPGIAEAQRQIEACTLTGPPRY